MIRVSTLSNQNTQLLVNDINSYVYKVYNKRKIISIDYVFNSSNNVYTAFITYEEEEQ